MKQYVQYRCWDLILCIFISIGLAVNVLSGFDIADEVISMPGMAAAVIILTGLCFAAAFNKTTSAAGILMGVAGLAALVIWCRSRNLLVENLENSRQIFYLVIVAAALIVFLASRTRAGILLLFLTGNLIHAGAAFLQYPCRLWAYILFLGGTGMMIFYRVYSVSLKHAHTGQVRFRGFMIQNLCVCLAALMLASGIFVGIIRPMNPPTDELKLIQKLMSLEVLEKIGVSSVLVQVDKEKESDELPDDQMATNQLENGKNEGEQEETFHSTLGSNVRNLAGNAMESMADQSEKAMAIAYTVAGFWYLYLIAIVVFIFLLLFLRKVLRKRWLNQIDQLSRADGIINLYNFFLYGLAKSGCVKPGNMTLDEYLEAHAEELHRFDQTDPVSKLTVFDQTDLVSKPVSFEKLTEIYRKAYYGRQNISEEEYLDFQRYYSAFHKKICNKTGKWKYMRLYFKL